MEFSIIDRDHNVIYTTTILGDESTPYSVKLGRAISNAIDDGIDFTGADLGGADMSGFDLEGVCFSDAYLKDANFEGSNIYNTDFKEA